MSNKHVFNKGDRVKVTDLRTGLISLGVITEPPSNHLDGSPYMNVKLDSGKIIRVGRGFVSHDDR